MKVIYPNGPKTEWLRQAEDIKCGKIQTSEDDIPMLLEWLQDMNWPGAVIIPDHLMKFKEFLAEPIRNILKTKDTIWIYWVLSSFEKRFDANFWQALVSDLEPIAYSWDEDGANVSALRIFARWKLVPSKKIVEIVHEMKQNPSADVEDYVEIESML